MNNKLNASLSNLTNQLKGTIETKNEIVVNILGAGPKGKEGLSAYEVWIAEGNKGTVDDFFQSIFGGALHADAVVTTEDKQFISEVDKLKIAGYIHDQIQSSSVWIVNHTLDKFPSVTVVDTGGSTVVGDVEYVTKSQLTILFNHEFSGKAYLN